MSKRYLVLFACFFALVLLVGLTRARAASTWQAGMATNVSLSALVFEPLHPDSRYVKDVDRHKLVLAGQSAGHNIFVAPLALPDGAQLLGLTVFGEDFDEQGEVLLRLKRCDHGQARCEAVAAATSGRSFSGGQFETPRVAVLNGFVDNGLYSYLLELELTALVDSGLRSVRVEVVEPGGEAAIPQEVQEGSWSLSGSTTNFTLPNVGWGWAQVCTDELGHLDNPTHYPVLVVDGREQVLASNDCATVRGYEIRVQRRRGTGPSSGTYRLFR